MKMARFFRASRFAPKNRREEYLSRSYARTSLFVRMRAPVTAYLAGREDGQKLQASLHLPRIQTLRSCES
jgi:hypothetical protein